MSNVIAPGATRFGQPGFIEAYGAAWEDTETLVSFFAEDSTYYDAVSGVKIQGHDMLRRFMKVYLRFSPDCVVTFGDIVESSDGFASEWMWEGHAATSLRTPDGEIPGNGAWFSVPGVSFCKVTEDGRIASHADYWDASTMVRQLAEGQLG